MMKMGMILGMMTSKRIQRKRSAKMTTHRVMMSSFMISQLSLMMAGPKKQRSLPQSV